MLTQQGTDVVVERPRGRLPLPPIDLLRDLHRARFSPAAAASEDGVTLRALGRRRRDDRAPALRLSRDVGCDRGDAATGAG